MRPEYFYLGACPMRRMAVYVVVAAALIMPGCYGYNSETADLAFIDAFLAEDTPAVDETEPQDTATPDTLTDTTGDASDVAECVCTCSPQPCTCTCTPGGECVFDPTDVPESSRASGAPCETDAQCYAGTCATTALLGAVWKGATAPDGMCTRLYCTEDANCGEGGICLDPSQLDPTVPKLCGMPCQEDLDCRCGVDYMCLDSLNVDDLGNPIKACLPRSLANLLACGAVTCEEGAN